MSRSRQLLLTALASALMLTGLSACHPAAASADPVSLPAPRTDPAPGHAGEQVAVFAGGCFWGVEAVFDHVRGVRQAWSGYAGGDASTAHYFRVGMGNTGHAESVKVAYDPAQVSYGQLLQVFFSVAHDPTQLNRQGPDRGSQYRSVVFYANAQQQQVANAYIAQLTSSHAFARPIVTQVVPLRGFYMAESYHQNYASEHPDDRYIAVNDAPKLVHLQQAFPSLYRAPAEVVRVQLH